MTERPGLEKAMDRYGVLWCSASGRGRSTQTLENLVEAAKMGNPKKKDIPTAKCNASPPPKRRASPPPKRPASPPPMRPASPPPKRPASTGFWSNVQKQNKNSLFPSNSPPKRPASPPPKQNKKARSNSPPPKQPASPPHSPSAFFEKYARPKGGFSPKPVTRPVSPKPVTRPASPAQKTLTWASAPPTSMEFNPIFSPSVWKNLDNLPKHKLPAAKRPAARRPSQPPLKRLQAPPVAQMTEEKWKKWEEAGNIRRANAQQAAAASAAFKRSHTPVAHPPPAAAYPKPYHTKEHVAPRPAPVPKASKISPSKAIAMAKAAHAKTLRENAAAEKAEWNACNRGEHEGYCKGSKEKTKALDKKMLLGYAPDKCDQRGDTTTQCKEKTREYYKHLKCKQLCKK